MACAGSTVERRGCCHCDEHYYKTMMELQQTAEDISVAYSVTSKTGQPSGLLPECVLKLHVFPGKML